MKKEDAALLLFTAMRNALPGLTDIMRTVIFKGPNVVESVATTLARLKFLEISMLQTLSAENKTELRPWVEMSEDLSKMVLMQMVTSGALKPGDAKVLSKHLGIESLIDEAAAGPKPFSSFEDAQKVLDESLGKMRTAKLDG